MPAGQRLRRRRRRALPRRPRRARAPTCRPTTPTLHVPRASLHAALAGAFGAGGRRSCRSTCALPTPTLGARMSFSLRRLAARRPRRDRGDRAGVVPDAVVALDVRERAREAELALDRRGARPTGDARRLPRALPLRRRVARDERRRRPRPPPPRDRLGDARSACFDDTRADAERGYTLEVRVSNGGAIASTSASASSRAASGAATTPTTARTP